MRVRGTFHSSYGRLPASAGRRQSLLALGAALALLAGCASPPPKPVVTPVAMTLTAAPDLNPDARGRPSPLTVRVYALKTTAAFSSADFFSLFDKDQATLAADIVQREELQFSPGERKTLNFTLPPEAKAVAVLAAYRDLEHARWRGLFPLEPGKPLALAIGLDARQVRIDAR